MSHESATSSSPPDLRPGGELRHYTEKGGRVDVVYKAPGATFSMRELANHFASNPADQNSGAALIQVVGIDGKPQNYYMDSGHAVEEARPWLVARLDKFPVSETEHDITVGDQWQSPFGITDPVHAVVLPYNRGYTPDMVTAAPEGKVSPTRIGRHILDQVVEQ